MKKANTIYDFDNTKLTQSFQEACSDKNFKDFIDKLNIKEEILEEYTSVLLDSYEEYKNCTNCPGLENCPNLMKGYMYTPNKDGKMISFSYNECKLLKKKEKNDAYKKNLDIYDMPTMIKEASLKNIYKDDKARVPIIKYFKEFMDNYNNEKKPKGIYLTGSFGSGKTYLIASLFNEMAKKDIKSIMIYFPDFLVSLKSSFKTNYGELFNEIKKVPLLLLDDIGSENVSNWSRDEVLGPILQYRMDNCLPTFFTSNLTLEELENNLSLTQSGVDKVKARRIIERIKQLTVPLSLISKNRRD